MLELHLSWSIAFLLISFTFGVIPGTGEKVFGKLSFLTHVLRCFRGIAGS